jgi:hypothetical protein
METARTNPKAYEGPNFRDPSQTKAERHCYRVQALLRLKARERLNGA